MIYYIYPPMVTQLEFLNSSPVELWNHGGGFRVTGWSVLLGVVLCLRPLFPKLGVPLKVL